ncbi:esterase-like activity of phytase family protein, partial [Pectobacterium brasiliense]|nr:esterase-like activity of phytase family protein [Pectobacterium brasiliense]
GKNGDDKMFTTLTHRGPKSEAPQVGEKQAKNNATPDNPPQMMDIRVSAKSAQAKKTPPQHQSEGKKTRQPQPPDVIGTTKQMAQKQ